MPGSADDAEVSGYRPLLFSIAYGMTGSVGDAEDIAQDAFVGLTRARQAGTVIADPKAYLTTAVTRLSINYLRSARVRRETYVGDWLPEPVVVPVDEPGPAEHAELADSLSMAFLVLLETLSPTERAVFMLREAFGYGYPEVAAVTGKTEANCRQIFARARQRIAAGGQAPRRRVVPGPAGGGGGVRPPVLRGGRGRRHGRAARHGRARRRLPRRRRRQGAGDRKPDGRDGTGSCASCSACSAGARCSTPPSGWPGSTASLGRSSTTPDGRVISVFGLDVADGVVQAIRSVVNPDKLGHLGPVSDVARLPDTH